jgi:hypothetical protein
VDGVNVGFETLTSFAGWGGWPLHMVCAPQCSSPSVDCNSQGAPPAPPPLCGGLCGSTPTALARTPACPSSNQPSTNQLPVNRRRATAST